MMTKTTLTKILVRCDVGLCDRGSGPTIARKEGDNLGLMLAEFQGAGWILGTVDADPTHWVLGDLDACPSCKEKMEARRGEPMEDPDGA